MTMDFILNGLNMFFLLKVICFLDEKNKVSRMGTVLYVILSAALIIGLDILSTPLLHIISSLLTCCILLIFIRNDRLQVLVDYAVAVVLLDFLQVVFMMLFRLLAGDQVAENQITMLITLLVMIAAMTLVNRSEKAKDWIARHYVGSKSFFLVVSGCILIELSLFFYMWEHMYDFVVEHKWLLFSFVFIFYGLSMVALVTIVRKTHQQDQLKLYAEYGGYLENMMEQMGKRQHEYYNEINTIIGLAHTQEADTAISRIIDYGETILGNKGTEIKSTFIKGQGMAAAVIYRKEQQAEAADIKFQHVIEKPFPDLPLSTYEMTEILVNLLNNAFEYVAELPSEKREVLLKISSSKIEVMNTVEDDFHMEVFHKGKEVKSSKGSDRGYGLDNVREITSRNGGKLGIYMSHGVIIFEAAFSVN